MQRKVWKLAQRPVGDIADSDLELVTETLPELADGQFLLAVLAFHEPFASAQIVAFAFIWLGLAAFSVDLWRQR